MDHKPASECVHCHVCRDNCAFLSKYGIDIGDTDKLKELAYHCFLCGTCTEVCPIGIDGRQTILDFRREAVSGGEKQTVEKTYAGLIKEKRNYIYRNWKHARVEGDPEARQERSTFFPGCNFPSMYPKTNALVVRLFEERGIGTVYECCGKPISELGFKDDEDRIIEEIRGRLAENNITEIITGCPNCRHFFGDRLGVKVTGIFTKLSELGLGNAIDGDFKFFVPCPDRSEKKWIEEIRPFINGNLEIIEGVQCCGLGGSAMTYESEIGDGFVGALKAQSRELGGQRLVTYCASCTGRFRRSGLDGVDHVLTLVLGTNEKPDTKKSYLNRVITRFK